MQETADLVTFTEEILNGKLNFLCNATILNYIIKCSILDVAAVLDLFLLNQLG